jgi:hypothetical protein
LNLSLYYANLNSGEELGELARQMAETKNPAEADRLKEDIVRGFYGDEPHA